MTSHPIALFTGKASPATARVTNCSDHQINERKQQQNCASSSDKFFMLPSSTAIATTFNKVRIALSKLWVSQIGLANAATKKARLNQPGFSDSRT
ncbi:hypothetical protein Q3C01_00645 [Bradyrhizobium sp. UFLA05-109]